MCAVKDVFFISSGEDKAARQENNLSNWDQFFDKEISRGINAAILIGGEPTLYPDRIEAFYKKVPTFIASNGTVKICRKRFPDLKIRVSIWGDTDTEKYLRGADCIEQAVKNYPDDPNVNFLYTISPLDLGKTEKVVRKIYNAGSKVHFHLLSNDDEIDGLDWEDGQLNKLRQEMDNLLETFPENVITSRYYHRILTSKNLLGTPWGYDQCPSVLK